MNIHIDPEFKELIPQPIKEDYDRLEESLLKDGCRDPLILWGNTLVDGHNRYEICTKHNIEFETIQKDFDDRNEAKIWMIENQLARRNVSTVDRITLADRERPLLEQQAKKRQQEAGKENGGDKKSKEYQKSASVICDISRSGEKKKKPAPTVRDQIAKKAGVSNGTVAKYEYLQRNAPELIEDVRNKKIESIGAAYTQAKAEEKKQKQEAAIQEQIDRPKTSNHIDIYTTENKYRVIYADPPWSYNDKQNTETLGGAEKHYPTMPLDDICGLPVPSADNAVLFLWVTSPLLEDCFKVINAWGFKYKSSFVWDKVKHNMGHYNSVRHEFLLICTKGNCVPDVQKLFDSVQTIERTDHSRKPKEFRDIIDTLYPAGNRLEMFAREAPKGWDVWGNMA